MSRASRIRQPGLILAVSAPGQLCLAGARRRRGDRLWVAGSGTGYSFASSAVMGPFPVGGEDQSGCVFCAIVAGEAEASVAFADDRVVAFMDLGAVTPGHVLIVPRLHAAGLEDLDEETSMHVWRIGHRIGRALRRSGLRCEGVNVFLADGEAAFQEIFHFHLHVFPRFAGDGFRISADWATRARHLLDEEARHIRQGLSALGFTGAGWE
jgi:histidine triad (HIT) family protein